MSNSIIFSKNYLRYNDQQTKNLCVVVDIPGLDLLTNIPIFTRIRYGDPHLFYGDGDVYGGFRPVSGVRAILDLDHGSATISQRNEPEQGRASIAQITLAFVDKDKYMTQAVSRGIIIPDIIGRSIRVQLGYQQTSYPEDYTVIFRGVVTDVTELPGIVTLQFSDPNFNRRQDVFIQAQSTVSTAISAIDTVINVGDMNDFPQLYLGPDGLYDVPSPWNQDGTYNPFSTRKTGVRTFFQIDNEWIEYGPSSISKVPVARLQSVLYTVKGAASAVSIQYTAGGIAGSEIVTILPATNQVNVQIQSGVSTASQVITAVNTSLLSSPIMTASLAPTFFLTDPQTAPAGPVELFPGVTGAIRGARGTTADVHAQGATVSSAVEITENCMIMALKLMLSGWDGPWLSKVAIFSIVRTFDSILLDQAGAIILPEKIDAIKDYGLTAGDYVTITGSGIPGNNITGKIVRFADLSAEPNRIIYLNQPTLAPDYPTTATVAFRSQYDTFPAYCSTSLTPEDVDVSSHIVLLDDFLSDPGDMMRFFLVSQETLKGFIESELYLPVSAYSLTKRGQLSVGMTKPPIAGDTLIFLNRNNVLDPVNISVNRSLNNRKFFNEVDYSFDFDDQGTSGNTLVVLDVDSLSLIGVSSILPIPTRGTRSLFGSRRLLQKRGLFILSRYKWGATIISIKCNWAVGCRIEAGDVIAISDNGDLQIANFDTGDRDIGTQLWEVIDRQLTIKDGNCQLQVISGIGSDVTDRYGVISPSSTIVSGTNSYLIVQDSFNAKFPGDELAKWQDYIGQPIVLHDVNYTQSYTTTIAGFDPSNNYKMFISGFTSLPPDFTVLIIDIVNYPSDASKLTDSLYKAIHVFFSPIIPVTGGVGISQFQFTVGVGDVPKLFVGAAIRIFNVDYSKSNLTDILVSNISGTTITLAKALGFVPDNTMFVSGTGFSNDKKGSYRYF